MERFLFVWDELDDWSGIAKHYWAGAVDDLPFAVAIGDSLSILACLPFIFL